MKTKFMFAALIAIAGISFTSCHDGIKSYSNDTLARPTVNDVNGDNPADHHLTGNDEQIGTDRNAGMNTNSSTTVKENPDSTKMVNDHTATGHDQH